MSASTTRIVCRHMALTPAMSEAVDAVLAKFAKHAPFKNTAHVVLSIESGSHVARFVVDGLPGGTLEAHAARTDMYKAIHDAGPILSRQWRKRKTAMLKEKHTAP